MAELDLSNHAVVLDELQKSQDADQDNRERAREAFLFLYKRDGQWEPYWWNLNQNKPRYTFDLTTPVVNQIADKIRQADFAGDIKPMGGQATEEVAEVYDGLVRNIQSMSMAEETYARSGRNMVIGGLDGWEIVQRYIDGDSFDQDLLIEKVENFVDRVWFDVAAIKQDKSDSRFAWKFSGFTKDQYKARWPEGSANSLGQNLIANAYFHKPELIMVAEFFFIKEVERELVLMSNNAVYEVNDDFNKIRDELKELGVVEVKRRKRKKSVVHKRLMDGHGWLDTAKETVFEYVPLIPCYGNYNIFENKAVWMGAVEKRIDPQRVFNYSMSREIEEGALAPRAKYWMTEKQQEGQESTLATMNTNADPVQTYTYDPDLGPNQTPQQNGGAQINPGLRVISETVGQLISKTAGQFEANNAENPRAQSGVAIEKLQFKGDVGSAEYIAAMEVAIRHTMRVIIKAAPRVYKEGRQIRLLYEDGTFEMVTLNERVTDKQTQEEVVLNNLNIGIYDVTCSAGPAFLNRQEETVNAMLAVAKVKPEILEVGADIFLKNITAPGMDLLAERFREMLFQAGRIPYDQMTEEEQQIVQQRQLMAQLQPPEVDPAMLIGQAEMTKANTDQLKAVSKAQNDQASIALKFRQQQFNEGKFSVESQMSQMRMMLETFGAAVDEVKKNAETLKILREAMGVDGILSPEMMKVFSKQVALTDESQEDVEQ